MAKKAGEALSGVIDVATNATAKAQVGINKILWGSGNTQPVQTVKYDPASGSLSYVVTPTRPKPLSTRNGLQAFIQAGLFNALDALNQVDLCNVITYVTTNINVKKKPRPPKENWTAREKSLYTIQDAAGSVVAQIDKYTAYPNTLIGTYFGVGPNAISTNRAIEQSGAPANQSDISGTFVKKYNIYNLIQSIKESLPTANTGTADALFTSEDRELLGMVPGLSSNINIINDFLKGIDKYTDYRSISNSDLRKLENKIATLRSVCVTIQNLDFKNGLALAGNFLGTDIRKQIQDISKFIDPTKIAERLRDVNKAIQSFIKAAQKVQGVIKTAQFLIKIGILFVKIFKFLIKFFKANPLPSLFTTTGIQSTLDAARQEAKDQTDSVTLLLKQINALLTVITIFIRYLLANANELLTRLQTIILTLEACDAMKDPTNGDSLSDVVTELKQTSKDLEALRDTLAEYIIKYDSKTNADSSTFGKYTIKVVDEEITDRSVKNKRRRGIALDINGAIVVQSDLTFATDPSIIINEVKLKLLAQGLVAQNLAAGLTNADLVTITESIGYLDDEDVFSEDFTVPTFDIDPPDNEDEEDGLGLNAFVNKLKGGKRLRRRARAAMAKQKRELADSLTKEDPKGSLTSKAVQSAKQGAIEDEIAAQKLNIKIRQEEITALYALSPVPNPATVALIGVKLKDIQASRKRIAELQRKGS